MEKDKYIIEKKRLERDKDKLIPRSIPNSSKERPRYSIESGLDKLEPRSLDMTEKYPLKQLLIDNSRDKLKPINISIRPPHYIVHDALQGRREIPVGIGEVQICVGHYYARDKTGREIFTPVYVKERF